jgi:hypothetical protein
METNMDSSLREAQSMQHSPLNALHGKTYNKRTVLLWWDLMSKENLMLLGDHAYLAIYGAYDAQKICTTCLSTTSETG